MLEEIIHLRHGIAVELRDMVQLPKVVTQLQVPIGLGDYDDGTEPRAGDSSLTPVCNMQPTSSSIA